MDIADLENRFTFHPAAEGQVAKYKLIRRFGLDFSANLDRWCPDSRELSLAITKIEEAVFWANAAIARNEKEN